MLEAKKLNLDVFTLVCVDCLDSLRAKQAIVKSTHKIDFGEVLFFSDKALLPSEFYTPVLIHKIDSLASYSSFILNKLDDFIKTQFALIIQWDGFVWNPNAWTDKFLEYDYIGAPWVQHNNLVGNGGFSLRSKKLLSLTKTLNYSHEREDVSICQEHRDELFKRGIKFAPYEIAYRFSVENEPYTNQFGWHGGIKPFIKE